jgi:hypothetical protein
MGNVLDPSKQQQVVALRRPGWSLRRIQQGTGVRRETVSDYCAVAVRGRGRPRADAPAALSGATSKPAIARRGHDLVLTTWVDSGPSWRHAPVFEGFGGRNVAENAGAGTVKIMD